MEIKIEEYKGEFLFQVEEVPQEDQQETKGKIKNYDYPFDFEFKKRKDVFNKYGNHTKSSLRMLKATCIKV